MECVDEINALVIASRTIAGALVIVRAVKHRKARIRLQSGRLQQRAKLRTRPFSYRAPALEELYNNGPHGGNLIFEIGNDKLKRESNDGIDFSLRHQNSRFRGELNYYYYHIKDFYLNNRLDIIRIFDR